MTEVVACVDVGSTFTKAALVAIPGGHLLGSGQVPTMGGTEVMAGVAAAIQSAGQPHSEIRACSSAGGGLRLAVVGFERSITAEAGARVGLCAGARIVHVSVGSLTGPEIEELTASKPDIVLLVGGTDGGNADSIIHNARALASADMRIPIVVAGNRDASADAAACFVDGRPVAVASNVLPRIGEIAPEGARAAIRAAFITHVIGGARGQHELTHVVRGATPDIVLGGVEVLAAACTGDVLVVDIGGATTDVYSVLAEHDEAPREAVETTWHGRTVEGDLGMRWNATGVLAAAHSERLVVDDAVATWAVRAADDVSLIPQTASEWSFDTDLARLAVTLAVRRHARSGRDLAGVGTVVLSGGVVRHLPLEMSAALARDLLSDHAGGWRIPRSPRCFVDLHYVLAPAGLLAADQPTVARSLLENHLVPLEVSSV